MIPNVEDFALVFPECEDNASGFVPDKLPRKIHGVFTNAKGVKLINGHSLQIFVSANLGSKNLPGDIHIAAGVMGFQVFDPKIKLRGAGKIPLFLFPEDPVCVQVFRSVRGPFPAATKEFFRKKRNIIIQYVEAGQYATFHEGEQALLDIGEDWRVLHHFVRYAMDRRRPRWNKPSRVDQHFFHWFHWIPIRIQLQGRDLNDPILCDVRPRCFKVKKYRVHLLIVVKEARATLPGPFGESIIRVLGRLDFPASVVTSSSVRPCPS